MGAALAALFVAALLLFLAATVRLGVVSPWITRGSRARLRLPDPRGVEAVCGFQVPTSLVAFYERAPYLTEHEIVLRDARVDPPAEWDIGAFVPLDPRDVREARTVHGVHDGIPIADDCDKGVYVVLKTGVVVHRSPNARPNERVVAESAEEMEAFVACPQVG